jgi:hypothetical protein
MSQMLSVELSDCAYAIIEQRAQVAGVSASQVAAAALEQQFGPTSAASAAEAQAARERFERRFGAVDLGGPTGADNEGIDADLAREYADDHAGK